MTGDSFALAHPGELPGWFGKLPGMGDFAHRRLPEAFRARWDAWLQHGLEGMRLRHEDWAQHYLEGPLWCFVLAPDVIGAAPWIGVLMPSVDGVGRYFPFTVASELKALSPAGWPASNHWWHAAGRAALEGLEQDLDAARFDAALVRHGEPGAVAGADERAAAPDWPAPGQSLWLTDPAAAGARRMLTAGLPAGERFDALFDCGVEMDHE